VTISISKGSAPVTVPDVTGAQESDAKTSLQALGLVPVSVPTTGTPSQVGTVISQSPDAGSTVAKGSQVQIDVGK
jgi:serine/threonine-protein kinase